MPVLLLAGAAASGEDGPRDWRDWRAQRLERLTAPDGWLTLVGLFWLTEPRSRLGSDARCEFRLAPGSAPPLLGTFVRSGNAVRFEAEPGVAVSRQDGADPAAALVSDQDGRPSVLTMGSLSVHLIERGGRLGVRVKDQRSPVRSGFSGLRYFPFDAAWQVQARFHSYPAGTTVPVPSVLGTVEDQAAPGFAEFEFGGRTLRLTGLDAGDGALFFVFSDRTNARETYGGGRFLYAPAPSNGVVQLDFNRAYNPPCAFTEFATCPLPPAQNRLAIAVRAGELRYGSH